MKCLVLSAVVLLCLAAVEARNIQTGRALSEYCYSTDTERPQYYNFNTKTAYQLARGGEPVRYPNGCTPNKFWLLSRHGTRLPSASKTEKLATLPTYHAEIMENYANGKQPAVGALCNADLELLRSWKWDANITADKDEFLTVQGWNDLKGLGQFYSAQFPDLFTADHSKYFFRHTSTQRTEGSYRGFVEGVFGNKDYYMQLPEVQIPEVDYLLKPHEQCSKWADQEAALEKSSSELSKFEDGEIYQQMAKDISTKAGYSTALKANRIKWMFEMCYYEKAWYLNQDSPWCSFFTMNEAKIFEYAKDIEEWNLGGSASTLNKRLGCHMIQDLLEKMENDQDGLNVVAYFAHSTTVQLLLTALGYEHLETPLLANNMEENANRTWRTSTVCPFTSNVAVVRYACADGVKLQFLHNERPLDLEGCTNGVCDWELVKSKYANFAAANCSAFFCTD